MNASDYIYALVTWLQSVGVTVELHAFDLHYGGLYRSETREIFLNVPNAESALMTLAHEAGHHVGYARYRRIDCPILSVHPEGRELVSCGKKSKLHRIESGARGRHVRARHEGGRNLPQSPTQSA